MDVDSPLSTTVGRLGKLDFEPGTYLYIGSAFGPGGIAARCGRHLKREKPLRWHIDYLTTLVQPAEVWWSAGGREQESAWAEMLASDSEFEVPFAGFGASDAKASSHLYMRKKRPEINWLSGRHPEFSMLERYLK